MPARGVLLTVSYFALNQLCGRALPMHVAPPACCASSQRYHMRFTHMSHVFSCLSAELHACPCRFLDIRGTSMDWKHVPQSSLQHLEAVWCYSRWTKMPQCLEDIFGPQVRRLSHVSCHAVSKAPSCEAAQYMLVALEERHIEHACLDAMHSRLIRSRLYAEHIM